MFPSIVQQVVRVVVAAAAAAAVKILLWLWLWLWFRLWFRLWLRLWLWLSLVLYYYTLYSFSVFSLAKSLQIILEISATYRLASYLLADNWLISRLHAQCMISNNNCNNSGSLRRCVCRYFLQTMYTNIIIRFGFCDVPNNQGLGKCY